MTYIPDKAKPVYLYLRMLHVLHSKSFTVERDGTGRPQKEGGWRVETLTYDVSTFVRPLAEGRVTLGAE